MIEKELQYQKDGHKPPLTMMSMSQLKCSFPRGSGKDITQRVDAARYACKPLGRAEGTDRRDSQGVEPPMTAIDISPAKGRRLEKAIGAGSTIEQSRPERVAGVGGVVGVMGQTEYSPTQLALNASLRAMGL